MSKCVFKNVLIKQDNKYVFMILIIKHLLYFAILKWILFKKDEFVFLKNHILDDNFLIDNNRLFNKYYSKLLKIFTYL